ncbi:MAG: hypothetical protein FJ135_12865 [Deltaproteobacteria bacterium]|nr:hypothetical protein [Deltaproteobacteria bacterium]
MWQVLASDTEVVIRSGYVYAPLLFDPQIKAELGFLAADPGSGGACGLSETLIQVDGSYFVRSLSLKSLVANYRVVFPEEYERKRQWLLKDLVQIDFDYQPPLDEKLATILFAILPHFLRPQRKLRRGTDEAWSVLAFLATKAPPHVAAQAQAGKKVREQEAALSQALHRLENISVMPDSPPPDRLKGVELGRWFQKALQAEIAAKEIETLEKSQLKLRDLLELPAAQLAVLFTIVQRGALEVDGFGFSRHKKQPGEYVIYKKTGDFALKDYFGQLYLFPGCRVGVATAGSFRPMVLDMYKHPLLRRFEANQAICLTDYQPPAEFSAEAVIRALEEGVNALFYGYNSRKRNGYNCLDKFGRHHSIVSFEDWRIPVDHPRIISGEVEVKNNFIW